MHLPTLVFELEISCKRNLGTRYSFCFMEHGEEEDCKSTSKTLEMENLSLDISTYRFSRDLLQSFMVTGSGCDASKEDNDDMELNLDLSLGGNFGFDEGSSKLMRSSSVASYLPVVRDDNDAPAAVQPPPPPSPFARLARTSSLPVETEDEWRKRKELQSLRRLEAKRRRSEKQRILKLDREGSGNLKSFEVNLKDREKLLSGLKRPVSLRTGIDLAAGKRKGYGVQGFAQLLSQVSMESRGASSSSLSDLESKNLQGSSGEVSPGSFQSLQEGDIGSSSIQSRSQMSKTMEMESPLQKPEPQRTRGKDIRGSNSVEDMPCVFTKGDGPNGRQVDGILYRYGGGAEVRIMCICHGNFHSPAEFVKHAGGTDVDHPLKHIVVNRSSSSSLL